MAGNLAPYKIQKRDGKFVVVNNANMVKGGPYDTSDEADKLLKALYANVPGAARKASRTAWTGKAPKPAPKEAAACGGGGKKEMSACGPDKEMGAASSSAPPRPYGNVRYADPKNGKYPVDTEAHVRAAWSYINQADNAAKYPMNGVTLREVRANIIAAAKRIGIDISEKAAAMPLMPTMSNSAYPAVMSELPDLQDCPECQGTGWDQTKGEQCPECDGAGMVPMHKQEMAQLILPTEGNRFLLLSSGPSVRQAAAADNPDFMWLTGRYVEADRPNRNKAMWTSGDLQNGQGTVAGGPLNWLHQERHIIGAIHGAQFVKGIGSTVGNHIRATSVAWPFLYPNECRTIETASANGQLFYSMECTSDRVTCGECQGIFPYSETLGRATAVCQHLRERSSVRRFVNPRFLGGAVIVPPARPGWAHADATVMRQAAALAEPMEMPGLTEPEAREIVAALLRWTSAA